MVTGEKDGGNSGGTAKGGNGGVQGASFFSLPSRRTKAVTIPRPHWFSNHSTSSLHPIKTRRRCVVSDNRK